MSHLKHSGRCECTRVRKGIRMRHAGVTVYPDAVDSGQGNVAHKLGSGWRPRSVGAAAAGSIAAPAGVLLPAAVVHVEEQRDDIQNVDVKKHHHHPEVGARAHAALVAAGQALAGRLKAQGRSRVLLSARGVLAASHGADADAPSTMSIWGCGGSIARGFS